MGLSNPLTCVSEDLLNTAMILPFLGLPCYALTAGLIMSYFV
jgi:hypothetical protein